MRYSHAGIETFVRQTLGCNCAEEVFQQIEQGSLETNAPEVPECDRFLIGRKLLIYVWEPSDRIDLERHLPALATTGRQERYLRGYNRFRLVVLVENPLQVQGLAEALFLHSTKSEENLHLHVLKKEDVAQVLSR